MPPLVWREATFLQSLNASGAAALYKLDPPLEVGNDWSSGFVGEKYVDYIVIVSGSLTAGRISNTLVFSTIAMSNNVRMVALDAMCSSRQEDQALVLKELGYTLVETPKIEAEVVGNPMRIVRLED